MKFQSEINYVITDNFYSKRQIFLNDSCKQVRNNSFNLITDCIAELILSTSILLVKSISADK